MKTFINWNIIQRIENMPVEFIGQRKVSLLISFLMGYEDIYLKLENEEQLQQKYEAVLSIDEYAKKKYHAEEIGTRSFRCIISYTCEDERDFFYTYLNFLREYEQQFPMDETCRFVLREKAHFELKDMLRGMRNRFPMYFGKYDLAELRAFLDGYFQCKKDYSLPLNAFDLKIKEFTQQIECATLALTGEYVTWDRKYRLDRDWKAWGEILEIHAKQVLEDFWKDLENFTKEKLDIPQKE